MESHHWNATLDCIRQSVPQPQFQRWFKHLALVRHENKTLRLSVPTRFHEDWLRNNYGDQLNDAVLKHFGEPLQLEFEVLIRDENQEASLSEEPISHRPALRVVDGGFQNTAENFLEDSAPALTPEKREETLVDIPRFGGEFFELDFNRLAHRYAQLFISGDPQINPLYIVSGVGMGKTRILSMIAEGMRLRNPDLRIRYTHAERFTSEILKSWKEKAPFQRQYRDETDILLFDDVQGLAGRKHTQEQLLHIFNEILARGGRVIFTSNTPAEKLGEFIEPLRSRLNSGVSAEIKPPTYQDRLELLSLVAQQNRISVDETVLRTLADCGPKDIRQVLGALLRLHLQSKLENQSLTPDYLAKEGLVREAPKEATTLESIIALIEYHYGVSRTDLLTRSRKDSVAWARQVAMYLGRRFTLMSLEDIGKEFGRNHTTVLYAYEKVKEAMDAQPTRKYEVEFVIEKLQASKPQRQSDDCPL